MKTDTLAAPVVSVQGVSLRYGDNLALDDLSLDIPANCMVGLIGPDGVGKSSLMSLLTGARKMQEGRITVLDGDIADAAHRRAVCPRIAYMPQGLGKNLYLTLSVFENVDFFGRLFGHEQAERHQRIAELLESTGLEPFRDRPAGKLSGGMKQKLGLCCALIHDPDLLVLDEPTTGVDPLSRAQFWELIERLRARRAGMSVLVSTAYMDEAERFDWLVAMDAGKILATGTASELRRTHRRRYLGSGFHPTAAGGEAPGPQGHRDSSAYQRRRAGDRHRGPRPDHAFRRFHRRRPCQPAHRARRDLRLSRFQRLRQIDDDENAHRPAATDRRRCAAVRPSRRRRQPGHAQACRLYVAGVLAVLRTDGAAKPGTARESVPFAQRRDPRPCRRDGGAFPARPGHGYPARRPAVRAAPAFVTGGGGDPQAGPADSRRADFRRRSDSARRLLGADDRSLAPRTGHHLHFHPLHERSRALRPHLADARRQGARQRQPRRARQEQRPCHAGRSLHWLSEGSKRPWR